MSEPHKMTLTPSWLAQLDALSPKEVKQINGKLKLLASDPSPDAKTKKRLKHLGDKIYRLRSGDFRILYTYDDEYVSILGLKRRDEATYNDIPEAEQLGGPDAVELKSRTFIEHKTQKHDETPLPLVVDEVMLRNLKVPARFHEPLVGIKTEEALFDLERAVPAETLYRIYEAIRDVPAHELLREKQLKVRDADDLIRYKRGDLIAFLLRLSGEQEDVVKWGAKAKGPTLLKGGPGTGKSTVAIYRVREMLLELKRQGVVAPKILFTTYTKALEEASQQLLEALLGDDVKFVEVRTADSLAWSLARAKPGSALQNHEVRERVARAIDEVEPEGSTLQKKSQQKTIEKLGLNYVVEELTHVIAARDLKAFDAYKAIKRPGRRVRLTENQRKIVWRIYERFLEIVSAEQRTTFWAVRAQAAIAAARPGARRYDAVVVDEAQDLEPTVLQMLVTLCRQTSGLFLTADANQSIYGASYSWREVHEQLRFVGRTRILKTNYRSTRELGVAAEAYLKDAILDDEEYGSKYMHRGPMPVVRQARMPRDELELLERFLPQATQHFGLTLGAACVLVPSRRVAELVAGRLTEAGVPAEHHARGGLELHARKVKVMTLKSAKGLEFPVVALAGFLDTQGYGLQQTDDDNARLELVGRERRALFVAMTRAMRALLVVTPAGDDNALFQGFDSRCWNL